MKHVIIILALLFVLFTSCTSKDIETMAISHLEQLMKEVVNRPDDAKLINVHPTYKSDSLCIIQFTLKSKNALGMDLTNPMEYIYFIDNSDGKKTYESYTDLKPILPFEFSLEESYEDAIKEFAKEGFDLKYVFQNKVEDVKKKYRKEILKLAPYSEKDPNIEDRLMYSAAWIKLLANGREISDNKGKDIKL